MVETALAQAAAGSGHPDHYIFLRYLAISLHGGYHAAGKRSGGGPLVAKFIVPDQLFGQPLLFGSYPYIAQAAHPVATLAGLAAFT